MSKLAEIKYKIEEYEKSKHERESKLLDVDANTRHELMMYNAPRLNFLAREVVELMLEVDLLSLIEEKDKALEFYANDANWHYDQLGDGLIGDGGETARVALKSTKEE